MRIGLVFLLVCLLSACSEPETSPLSLDNLIHTAYKTGNFNQADSLICLALETKHTPVELLKEYDILKEKMDRIVLDFNKNEEQIREQLSETFPDLSAEQLQSWEQTNQLEMRLINGEKRYFKYAVNNLYRLNSLAKQKKEAIYGPWDRGLSQFCTTEAKGHIERAKLKTPQKRRFWHIQYTITVDAGVVPGGEIIKCWMPFPKENAKRQSNIQLLSVNSEQYVLADGDAIQRSLYLEKKASDSIPTQFQYEVQFSTQGEWHDPQILSSTAVKTQSDLTSFTQEELPHIAFTESVKQLADSLTAGITNQYDIVKALYYWIDSHIPWASALEYSTFDCIPDYVLHNRHGDCGMVSFLFLSMARYKGVTAKWQSGWMLHPGYKNLHDWVEVYYENRGWVPLDMSFGRNPVEDEAVRDFYLSGMDAFRMIINDGIAAELQPKKIFYRSEPFDFQRGELEWKYGNLYFNQWDYSLKIIETHEE